MRRCSLAFVLACAASPWNKRLFGFVGVLLLVELDLEAVPRRKYLSLCSSMANTRPSKEANFARGGLERIARPSPRDRQGGGRPRLADVAAFAAVTRSADAANFDCRAAATRWMPSSTTTEERDEYQNNVIKLEQQLKEAKASATRRRRRRGVIQAKLDGCERARSRRTPSSSKKRTSSSRRDSSRRPRAAASPKNKGY